MVLVRRQFYFVSYYLAALCEQADDRSVLDRPVGSVEPGKLVFAPLFTANATERVARKKPIVVNLGFFTERLPLWLLPVAALLCLADPLAALLLFFVAYACHGLGAGAIAPAWSDMFARCFPVEKRGWFFGFTAFVGTGLGAVGAVYSGQLLEAFPYPINFAIVFLIAAVAITISWFFIAMTREPVQRVHDEILRQNGQSWPKIVGIVRGDKNFRNFLLTRLLATLARMGAGFITVAAIYRWQVSDSTVGLYTAALLFGQTAGNLVAGVLADRRGHKLSLEWGLGASTVAFALAWWAPTPEWFYVVFFLTGVANGMTIVSGVLIVMEFSRAVHRPTYVGIGNTVSGIGMVVAPLIGGVLAVMGYNWLFAASALVGVAALVMLHVSVREPRDQTEFYEVAGPEPVG